MIHIDYLEDANDVPLFLDDSFGKIAPQELSDIDADGVAVLKRRRPAHRCLAHHDRSIGVDHFQGADPLVVIAKNFQQHIAARSRRKKDIVCFEQARIVRDQILGLGGLELETAAHRASAAAQIEQIHLAVVVENNPVLERRFDLRPGLQFTPLFSTASTSRNAFTRTFKPKVTSSALSRERERSSCTSSPSLCTRTKICGRETFFFALK